MLTDASGTLLLVMEVVGPLLLLGALFYGTMAYRRRSARLKQEGDKETKTLYRRGDT
jgi:hypothetical protein